VLRPNLRVITEATYEQGPAAWRGVLANVVRGLGAGLVQPGLQYGPPLEDPANGCQAAAKAANVSGLYVWVDTPTRQAQWDAFGAWLADGPVGRGSAGGAGLEAERADGVPPPV